MALNVTVAEYLFTRLRQLGVQSIHGVPGDYNLELLDYVEKAELHWVGNCNELNAGYAADAYARIKGLGALITTFGVGELSAVNAIAGAYAELAPVVHIVGTPARHLQDSRALIHHTFNDGDFRRFAQMHAHITVAQANLQDPRTCSQLIDSTIQECLIHSRPVYIELPSDMVSVPVDAGNLQSKLQLPSQLSSKDEAAALTAVLERIYASERPMILVDGESRAYGTVDQVLELVKSTQWPTFTTVFGKSIVDETLPNFHGIWKGNAASQDEKDFVNSRDLILCIGPHFSTTNTYASSSIPDPAITVLFRSTTITYQQRTYRDLPAKHFLSKLLGQLDLSKTKRAAADIPLHKVSLTITPQLAPEGPIIQDQFYRLLSPFFQPGDIILAETGTAGYGCRDFTLPPHTVLFKPATWLSIGYMLPAAQGASLAQRELHAAGKWYNQDQPTAGADHSPPPPPPPRTILLIGDGSFQMTAQELSTIIRQQLPLTIFLLNNAGYTIEKCLHGWDRAYNDIAAWRYLQAPRFMGAKNAHDNSENRGETETGKKEAEAEAEAEAEGGYAAHTFRVETWGDLRRVMADERMREREEEKKGRSSLRMVEVVMGSEDAPELLSALLQRQKNGG